MNKIFPFLETLKDYNRNTFFSDLTAGVMVAILLVPQAIAYAYLAGVPPQYGLYAALVPILLYAFFGTSPHMAIGPVAISAILVLAGVSQLVTPFSPKYIQLVIFVGIMIGVIQVLLGLLKQGRIVNLLSYPIITGFTSAASIIIISSQMKDVLGIESPKFESLWSAISHLISHINETHVLTLAIAATSFAFIMISNRVNGKFPSRLILVALGIAVSYFFDLSSKGVDIIGFVPSGLPGFQVPTVTLNEAISLLPTVLLVTIIGIIESIGIAKALENKNDFYEIDTNRELFALGISKIGGSFFSALPSSASFSRSALLHQTQAKTNLASMITVFFVVISLLFLTPFLFYLPKVILAIIIIYAVKNLFEYKLGKHLLKLHKFDFAIMLVTFLATLFVSLEAGVAIGFLASFFILIKTKASTSKGVINVFRQNYKKDIHFKSESNRLSLTIEDDLHFGNAYYLKDLVKKMVNPSDNISEIEIFIAPHCDMDSSAIKALRESLKTIKEKNISYHISGCNEKLTRRFKTAHIVMEFHPKE